MRAGVAAIALLGLADDLWSGPERGFRAHLATGSTTGVLKLVGIPLVGARDDALAARARCSSALAANVLNQLDTRPGRALKAFLAGAALVRATGAGLRRRSPSCSLPTISARWRCSETQGRTRWAPC